MATILARRRGVVPNNLRQRIDQVTSEFALRQAARMLSHTLDGIAPSALTDDERSELLGTWGELGERALAVLEQVGYGARGRDAAAQSARTASAANAGCAA